MMSETGTELKIKIVADSNDALWDEFVANSPQGTFFQKSIWIKLITEAFGLTSKRLFCLRNNQTIGGLQYYESKKLIWRVATPTPLVPFTAPLFYAPNDERLQKRISNYLNISSAFCKYLDDNLDFWILDASHTFTDSRAFIWQGALVEPRHTYVINLTEEEDLIDQFNQSTRKKLKLAKKEKIKILESDDPSILIKLVSNSYYRHNRNPLLPEIMLEKIIKPMIKLPNVKLYYLSMQNRVRSARLIVEDRQIVYDLLAGGDDETGFASAYLISNILTRYCHSHRQFDFMGADHPDIEKFKRGFGGELRQGFRISGKVGFPLSMLIKLNEYRLNKNREL